MVSYVKPGALGDIKKFRQLFEEIIQGGAIRAGAADDAEAAARRRKMNKRVFALAKKLDTLVQVALTPTPLTSPHPPARPPPAPPTRSPLPCPSLLDARSCSGAASTSCGATCRPSTSTCSRCGLARRNGCCTTPCSASTPSGRTRSTRGRRSASR